MKTTDKTLIEPVMKVFLTILDDIIVELEHLNKRQFHLGLREYTKKLKETVKDLKSKEKK